MASIDEMKAISAKYPSLPGLDKYAKVWAKYAQNSKTPKVSYYINLIIAMKLTKFMQANSKSASPVDTSDIKAANDKYMALVKKISELSKSSNADRIPVEEFIAQEYDRVYNQIRNGEANDNTPEDAELVAVLLEVTKAFYA